MYVFSYMYQMLVNAFLLSTAEDFYLFTNYLCACYKIILFEFSIHPFIKQQKNINEHLKYIIKDIHHHHVTAHQYIVQYLNI